MNNSQQLDIIFAISGRPLPAMLDMAYFAVQNGQKAAVVILERGQDDLRPDEAMINYEVITVPVPYKSVDLRRVLTMPAMYRKLKGIITSRLKPGGVIVTASYDLLVFAYLMTKGGRYRIRHQVRDLHALQLSRSLKARMFIEMEKRLLRRVERVVVSSPKFDTDYYRKIYGGEIILLENVPAKSTWMNFRRQNGNGVFRIGFIGILRYKPSLYQLIDAVEQLASTGMSLKVLFAGGGDNSDLKARISRPELFEFRGPYEYTKDIKELYSGIDLIYAVYDSEDLNCQLAMPNKFYESIIARIPIIVASGTFVGEQVAKAGIGTTVRSGDPAALAGLLAEVRNPGSWYGRAIENLETADAEPYYGEFHRAMKKSVLQ